MRKFLSLLLAAMFIFTLAACGGDDEPADTTPPTFSGVDNVTIYLDEDFDLRAGVTATDNQGNDITSDIEIVGQLDTSEIGVNFIRYRVEDEFGNSAEASRYVTVEVDPDSFGDELLPNGDFSLGMAMWTNTQGLEGGTADFEVVDGELKIDIKSVTGGLWEPRLENLNITFEQGVSYKVSFEARALEPRSVHLQVGELLPSAPWFNNFKPGQTEIFDLSTEMQTFEFVFTMTQETNDDGGVIFEFGTVEGGVGTDNLLTTVFLDNVLVEETEPVFTEPTIMGATDVTIEVGTDFDPLAGVTAYDAVEGDLDLTLDNVTGTVDTTTTGAYTLTYTVENSEGLSTSVERVITVVDLIFNETDIITNGDFEEALDEETPAWYLWQADWDPNDSPMTDGSLTVTNGAMYLEVEDLGSWGAMGWLLQATQDIQLQRGYTYKVVFDAYALEARDINAVVGFQSGDDWMQHGGGTYGLLTDSQSFEFTFTVDKDAGDIQEVIKFEFGHDEASVIIENVEILVLDAEPLQSNGDFESSGWHMWYQNWGSAPVVDYGIEDEAMVVTITETLGDANWAIQLLQENLGMTPGGNYRVTFDAFATDARDINFKFIEGAEGGKEFYETFTLATTNDTYTFDFEFDSTFDFGRISIELGAFENATVGAITFDNISIVELDDENDVVEGTDIVINGTFDQILDWHHWSQDWDTTPTVSKEVVDGELVVDISDNLGDHNWSVQVFQGVEGLTPGAQYTMEFEMKSSAARDINAKLIAGDGLEIVEVISLTDEMTRFVFTFDYNFDSTTANINFEFGKIGDAEVGTITIDNVMLYRNLNQ